MFQVPEFLPTRFEPLSLAEALPLGEVLARSGFFQDSRDPAKAVVKIMLGAELGITPITAMTSIYVIDSKAGPRIVLSVHVMASLVKRSQRYDYKVVKRTPAEAEIEFFSVDFASGERKLASLGSSRFSWQDAVKAELAGKANYQHHPADMLYARAMSAGVKTFCPDVLHGDVYTDGDFPEAIPVESRVVASSYSAQAVKPLAHANPALLAQEPNKAEVFSAKAAVSDSQRSGAAPSPPTIETAAVVSTEAPAAQPLAVAMGLAPGSSDLAPDPTPENKILHDLADFLPVTLATRIASLPNDDARLLGDDQKDVNGILTELLGKSGALSAWKSIGVKPSKGAIVTKGHVRALAALVANPQATFAN